MAAQLKMAQREEDPEKRFDDESIHCGKCGQRVTTSAVTCIHCGAKLKGHGGDASKPTLSDVAWIGGGALSVLAIIGIVWFLSRSNDPQELPPPPEVDRTTADGDDMEADDVAWRETSDTARERESDEFRGLRLAAEAGDASAQYRLGMAYLAGDDVDEDVEKGVLWLQQAGQQNNKEALFQCGTMLLEGDRVQMAPADGAQLIQQAAELDHTEAQYQVGLLYDEGVHVSRDATIAATWYQKAADKNHAGALTKLGFMSLRGDGVEPNMSAGVMSLRRAADMGMPEGLEELTTIVRNQVSQDIDKKYPLTKRGDDIAIRRFDGQVFRGTFMKVSDTTLSMRTDSGQEDIPLGDVDIGNRIRTDKAFRELFVKARIEENLAADMESMRPPLDPSALQSFADIELAAEKGYVLAQRQLGLAYFSGNGVRKDYPSAFVWFRVASLQGDPVAQYSLGWMYFQGYGIAPNESAAIGWMSRAADQNHPKAKAFLQKHLAAKENAVQLLEEARKKRQEEVEYHTKRLEEIRNSSDYNQLGVRIRR